ncbi:gasdermin-E isoform X2 [Hyla sarda]|uniref:gasdermin-E isoform X2 n=1 Tax=Hyla sarda TaxID=327740 RepID=UPI0024C2BB09|nr:gasdermin-E isoform X2 [Hyla sarda]
MFAKASKNFLRDIDAGGELISISSLNDSDKAQLLSVVAKKKRFWCWQKPKYHFSSCACLLGDVLTEETALKPVVVESEFVTYEGKFGDLIQGNMEADFATIHGNVGGTEKVESQSSFGTLRKQEVDMQHLMKDVQDRKVNLHHPFIQQLNENKNDILCILKEKIVTTQKCVISQQSQIEETCKVGGKLGVKAKSVTVSVTESGNFKDENTVLEIPAPTAIAYGVVELFVKHDGHFESRVPKREVRALILQCFRKGRQHESSMEFCLLSEKQGGFEKKSEMYQCTTPVPYDTRSLCDFDVVDGFRDVSVHGKPVLSNAALSVLQPDLLELTKWFAVLQELPEPQREELYNLLCEILEDGQVVAQIQAVVEEICLGSKPGLTFLNELKSSQKERAQKILSLVGYDLQNEKLTEQSKKDVIATFHVLTSALDEMPDSALTILAACCKLHLLPALCALPNITSHEGLCSRTEPLLSDLVDQGTFPIVQRLFSLSNVRLEMNENAMSAITFKDPGFLPLILYISVSGFHALIKT